MKGRGNLYVMGIDQMVLPLTKQIVKEGAAPTLAKLLARGSVFKALASYPCRSRERSCMSSHP